MALGSAEGGNTMQKYSPEKGNMSEYHHAGLDSVLWKACTITMMKIRLTEL
jgi:hypothetical protein